MTQSTDLTVASSAPAALSTVLGVKPKDMMAYALEISDTLTSVLRDRGMTQKFGQGEHVKSEGWQLAGSLLGFTTEEKSVVERADGTYEAVVELRTKDGRVVATASHICGTDEPNWKGKARYARRSMAVTRAISRAYVQNFRWIIKLAGYETTPAEEMSGILTNIQADQGEAYEGGNAKHKARLAQELAKTDVPREAWSDIHMVMEGKQLAELADVVADYWKEQGGKPTKA
jgi:hypothetical protein